MEGIHVIKRDGKKVAFNVSKILNAIFKAFNSIDYYKKSAYINSCNVTALVKQKIHYRDSNVLDVETIQDIVEEILMSEKYYKVARAYIKYREQRRKIRDIKQKTEGKIPEIMENYLVKKDWRVKENSHVSWSLGGLIMHNNGALTANYWLSHIYSEKIAEAHKQGFIHIHDLSMFSGYCAGWSLGQLIQEGINGVDNKISSSPAKHLNVLTQQIVNFLGILQNEWAGAMALSSVDTYLAPFVYYDKLEYNEVEKIIQSLVFGLNIPSRWGSQSPFTNFTFDWVIPDDMKDKPVVIGGELRSKVYGDFQEEVDMINRAFLNVMLQGDCDNRGFDYPIPTYNITDNFNWDSENADLLFKITGKYGTPYFQNFVNSDLNPGDVRSMCCRLQLDKRELRKRSGGLFGSDELTGSIGVVTINIPRIISKSHSEQYFFEMLDLYLDIAKDSLEEKRKIIGNLLKSGLFPYTKRYLRNYVNHFSTIGVIGVWEAVKNAHWLSEGNFTNFSVKVLKHIKAKLKEYQNKTGNLYNVEATPAEGTSYRLAKIDSTEGIVTSGTKEHPYYTNSTQLPVGYTDDIFHAMGIQNNIQTEYTGGTVFHTFISEAIQDTEIAKNLVKKIAYNYELPYYTITPTFSVCANHGYLKGEQFTCPDCGSETEVYSRIVGYYRPVKNWNDGKKKEYKDRVEYKIM